MRADFCESAKYDDRLRPNASLGLFYKDSGKVRLVFYTRFLVISYYSYETLRQLFRDWDNGAANAKNDIFDIYKADTKKKPSLPNYKGVWGVWRKRFQMVSTPSPRQYTLGIREKFHVTRFPSWEWADPLTKCKLADGSEVTSADGTFGEPWITLNGTGWMGDNAIHGTINTKGCWIPMRNFVWNWPRENGAEYPKLAAIYTSARGRRRNITMAELKNNLTVAPSWLPAGRSEGSGDRKYVPRLTHWGQNPTYLLFMRYFAGVKFNALSNDVFFIPPGLRNYPPNLKEPDPQLNCWWGGPKRGKDILTEKCQQGKDYWDNIAKNPWADVYLYCRTDRFTNDQNDTAVFK